MREQRIFFGGKSQEYRVVVGARYAGWIILELLIITVEINISTAGSYNLIVKQIGAVSIVKPTTEKMPSILSLIGQKPPPHLEYSNIVKKGNEANVTH